jgi:hypothetical protein
MQGKRLAIPLILSFLVLLTLRATISGAAYDYPPPYTGVIQNHSSLDISFQSQNSGAVVVVPAEGFLEFTVWSNTFDLIGYVDGKPVFCQKIKVSPRTYQFMCKSYDFMAEIKKEKPAPKAKKKVRKRKRKTPKGEGVEGFG